MKHTNTFGMGLLGAAMLLSLAASAAVIQALIAIAHYAL